MIWNGDELVKIVCKPLFQRSARIRFRDCDTGIDCLNQAELQRRIAEILNSHNVLAVKEARYPAARVIERLNHGRRRDLLMFRDQKDLQLASEIDAEKAGYWLEIKRVAQFFETGPNWHYERTLLERLSAANGPDAACPIS